MHPTRRGGGFWAESSPRCGLAVPLDECLAMGATNAHKNTNTSLPTEAPLAVFVKERSAFGFLWVEKGTGVQKEFLDILLGLCGGLLKREKTMTSCDGFGLMLLDEAFVGFIKVIFCMLHSPGMIVGYTCFALFYHRRKNKTNKSK